MKSEKVVKKQKCLAREVTEKVSSPCFDIIGIAVNRFSLTNNTVSVFDAASKSNWMLVLI